MPGGLLNIISEGNNNVILTGTPTKTFFNVTYSKYTNFGLQKFRLDYEGSRDLRTTTVSTFKFKVKRYAELLMDTYLIINLPDIWSPIYPPCSHNNQQWAPYEYKWIRDLGTHIIREVVITCGTMTLQKYTGEYLAAMVERDFDSEKKKLFNEMTGNIPELYEPESTNNRSNCYPSAFFTENTSGAEPSIRGRALCIPINTWFTLDTRCAFPLISLQYNELEITITLRPIQELFQIRDIFDTGNNFPYIQPDFNRQEMQMYRFLQTPPSIYLDPFFYQNQINTWNADIHLMATYCFLSKDEAQLFAAKEQIYLIKDVFTYNFENVTGSKKVNLTSNGMIANWMFYLQRNDVNLRNEWSNYTNWAYRRIPYNIQQSPQILPSSYTFQFSQYNDLYPYEVNLSQGPYVNPYTNENTGIYYTGDFSSQNEKNILQTMGILLNGEYRENMLAREIYGYIEKYTRTKGFAKDGLYCYNFCLNTSPFEYQPSGAINMSKFKTVELELTTYIPELSNNRNNIICDGTGNAIGIDKQNWTLYDYNYNLTVFEERYNILSFVGGNCGMLYAR